MVGAHPEWLSQGSQEEEVRDEMCLRTHMRVICGIW